MAATVKKKLPTFDQARDAILDRLKALGWALSDRGLKIPHATSPDGKLRLWFKTQAVHYTKTAGTSHVVGDAHAIAYGYDIRKVTAEEFVRQVGAWFSDVNVNS